MEIKLKDHQSRCEERQKIIVAKDSGSPCKYIAQNESRNHVRFYRIDGEVIKDGCRCDFFLLNIDKQDAYYIETKGSDIEHAITQIEETEKILSKETEGYQNYYRIVFKSGTHDLYSSRVTKWKKKCGINKGRVVAIVKNNKLEEII